MSEYGMVGQPEDDQCSHPPEHTGGKRYILRQKMVSIGNDYWVENERGEKVYLIDGKIGLHRNFIFEDMHGKKLAKIHKTLLSIKETMEIEGPEGEKLAIVKKDLFTPLKEHFVVHMKNSPDLEIRGNILDHEYTIRKGSDKVAQVSKKLFHLRDSYTILIEPVQEDIIILAAVVCIDEMAHPG